MKPAVALAVVALMALVLSFPAHSAPLADKSGNNWSFKLNALYAYDDNVVQAPTRSTFKPAPRPSSRSGPARNPPDSCISPGFEHRFRERLSDPPVESRGKGGRCGALSDRREGKGWEAHGGQGDGPRGRPSRGSRRHHARRALSVRLSAPPLPPTRRGDRLHLRRSPLQPREELREPEGPRR